MEHGASFYFLLGAAAVAVPAITDRLLKNRVTDGWRVTLVWLAATLNGAILVVIARLL